MSATANPLMLGAPNPGANFAGWSVPTNMPGQPSGGANPFMPLVNPSGANPSSNNPYSSGFGSYAPPNSGTPRAADSGFPANNNGYGTTNLAGTGNATGTPSSNPDNIGLSNIQQNATNMGYPSTPQGQKELFTNLEKAYGKGMAGTLMNFLSSGAGFNQSAINNLIAAMQPGFNNAQQNLLQQFSAGGSRFSSGAALGLSNLQSQEQLNIGALESQMYEQSVNNYMDVLMGASQGSLTEQERLNKQNANFLPDLLSGIVGGAADIFSGGLSGILGSLGGGGGAAASGGGGGGGVFGGGEGTY